MRGKRGRITWRIWNLSHNKTWVRTNELGCSARRGETPFGYSKQVSRNAAMRPKTSVPEGLPSKAGVCFVAGLGHMSNYGAAARVAHPPALKGNASHVLL
jgi:hypothetical protein